LIGRGFENDGPAVGRDDIAHDGHAQSGACFFAMRDKRLENLALDRGRNPGAIVLHGQIKNGVLHPGPDFNAGLRRGVEGLDAFVTRFCRTRCRRMESTSMSAGSASKRISIPAGRGIPR